ISGASNDTELFVRLVNMLMAGIPSAAVVALVVLQQDGDNPSVQVLHWDRRLADSRDFQPSRRLISEAVAGSQSVLHVWNAVREAASSSFTMTENLDWAFCTPIASEACPGWALYVAGKFSQRPAAFEAMSDLAASPEAIDQGDVREDL